MVTDRQPTGLGQHGLSVALTPARALTSHLRKRYLNRYAGRYRYARVLFAFELVLLCVTVGLIILNLALLAGALSPREGLSVTLELPRIVADTPLPMDVTLRATDGKIHNDVRLTWHLPSEVEILQSEPPLQPDGTWLVGRVVPGQEKNLRFFLRARAIPGASVPLRYDVYEGIQWGRPVQSVTNRFVIDASAVSASLAIPATTVTPGASLPIVIVNRSRTTAAGVILHLTRKDGALQAGFGQTDEFRVGDLAPDTQRVVYLDVGKMLDPRVDFEIRVQDVSRPVYVLPIHLASVKTISLSLNDPRTLRAGSSEGSIATHATEFAHVWLWHPLQDGLGEDGGRLYDVSSGDGRLTIPLSSGTSSAMTWSAIPVQEKDGGMILGPRLVGALSDVVAFDTTARYYATTGDQLGVGPLPPKVGEPTSYWIIWSVGPHDRPLADILMQGNFAPGVRATGAYTSTAGGVMTVDAGRVSWSVPLLPAATDAPQTFGFEVEVTPTTGQRGTYIPLINASTVEARDADFSFVYRGQSGTEDTRLQNDAVAAGKGKVE